MSKSFWADVQTSDVPLPDVAVSDEDAEERPRGPFTASSKKSRSVQAVADVNLQPTRNQSVQFRCRAAARGSMHPAGGLVSLSEENCGGTRRRSHLLHRLSVRPFPAAHVPPLREARTDVGARSHGSGRTAAGAVVLAEPTRIARGAATADCADWRLSISAEKPPGRRPKGRGGRHRWIALSEIRTCLLASGHGRHNTPQLNITLPTVRHAWFARLTMHALAR